MGAAATPFALKFCIIFIEFLENKKSMYLYSWQVGKCPGHPFLKFLDLPVEYQCTCNTSKWNRSISVTRSPWHHQHHHHHHRHHHHHDIKVLFLTVSLTLMKDFLYRSIEDWSTAENFTLMLENRMKTILSFQKQLWYTPVVSRNKSQC